MTSPNTSSADAWIVVQAIAAAGMLVFAGVQVYLVHRAEHARQQERAADDAAALDVAYGVVWAEYNRIFGVKRTLEEEDLLRLALSDLLDPQDILPRDWASVTNALGRLGVMSAEFGGVAFTLANDLHRKLCEFQAVANAAAPIANAPLETRMEMAVTYAPTLREIEAKLKGVAVEIDNLLLDALEHARNAHAKRQRAYNEKMYSRHGTALLVALAKLPKEQRDAPPPGSFHVVTRE